MRTLAIALVVLCACSSEYMPASRGRVAVIMRSGGQAYVRDGRVYEHGFLGGGLVDAVAGNPQATRAANEYHDRMKIGLLGMLGGLACSIGGIVYSATGVDNTGPETDDDETRIKTGLFISLGCTVVMIVGGAYLGSAEPYRWDAINIFNDQPPPGPMMPGPGYGPPRMTMKMRD